MYYKVINQKLIHMKTSILLLPIVAIIFAFCTPNNGNTNSTNPPGPIITNSNVYGGTLRDDYRMTHGSGPTNNITGYHDYSAQLVDANGILINGGTLQANNSNLVLSATSNTYFVYAYGMIDGPCDWYGGGSPANSIPAFHYRTKFAPYIPANQFDSDTTYISIGCNYTHPVIKADSIEYTLKNFSGVEIKKLVLDSSKNMVFSPSELSVFNNGDSLRVITKAWTTEIKTIGSKYYKFIECSHYDRASHVEP